MDVDLGHGAVPFPPGDQAEFHLAVAWANSIPAGRVCQARVANAMGVHPFLYTGVSGEKLQGVLDGAKVEPPLALPVIPNRNEERGIGIVSPGVDVEPLLEVRDGTDQAQTPPAGLAIHDDDRPILVELDVADVKACEFPHAGSGVPHQHEEGAVVLPLALVHQFLDILAGDELVDGKVRLYPSLLDVSEQFRLLSREQPAKIEFELRDVLVDRDRAEVFPPVDYVVFKGDVGDLFRVLKAVKLKKMHKSCHIFV